MLSGKHFPQNVRAMTHCKEVLRNIIEPNPNYMQAESDEHTRRALQ